MKELSESSDLWYVFNDFAVNQIQAEEVISFFPDWKLPCLLVYSVTTYCFSSTSFKYPSNSLNLGFLLQILEVGRSSSRTDSGDSNQSNYC